MAGKLRLSARGHQNTVANPRVIPWSASSQALATASSAFTLIVQAADGVSFRAELEKRNPGLVPYYGKLPTMTHSDIARDFVRAHDDFVSIYDRANETGVWLPATHWKLEDSKDANLRRAIRRHLDDLFQRYPEPEEGKRDPRRALKQAAFVTGIG